MHPRRLGLASTVVVAAALAACSTPRRLAPVQVEAIEVADASAAPPVVASAAPEPAPAPAPTPPPAPAPAAPAPAADADDVREAAFRHMFRKNASGMQQNARVLCLELEGKKDPPAAFLARFRDLKVVVRAGSGCTMSASGGVTDRATGSHGLAFRVDAIKWTDADHAEVEGGYYEAGLSASGNVYTLERKNGVWVVTKDVMLWIS